MQQRLQLRARQHVDEGEVRVVEGADAASRARGVEDVLHPGAYTRPIFSST
jgi:hypothetical protein